MDSRIHWMNEWVSEWMNDWKKQCRNEFIFIFIIFLGPTSTKRQAEILKLNNVNGCNDISFGDHSILEGDRIPPLNSHEEPYYYYRKKRFRWYNVKRLQGHLTNTKQNSTSATQQNERSIYQLLEWGKLVCCVLFVACCYISKLHCVSRDTRDAFSCLFGRYKTRERCQSSVNRLTSCPLAVCVLGLNFRRAWTATRRRTSVFCVISGRTCLQNAGTTLTTSCRRSWTKKVKDCHWVLLIFFSQFWPVKHVSWSL